VVRQKGGFTIYKQTHSQVTGGGGGNGKAGDKHFFLKVGKCKPKTSAKVLHRKRSMGKKEQQNAERRRKTNKKAEESGGEDKKRNREKADQILQESKTRDTETGMKRRGLDGGGGKLFFLFKSVPGP